MSALDRHVLDEGAVRQLASDLGVEELRHIVSIFEGDVRMLEQALLAAAGSSDLDAFRRTAHRLAGASGAVGAVALDMAAREAMRRQDAHAIGLEAASIRTLGRQSLTALQDFLRGAEPLQ